MLVIAAQFIAVISFGGMAFMMARKIPVLKTLPLESEGASAKRRIKFSFPSFNFRFHKRETSKKKEKHKLSDDYWEKVRRG